MEANDGVRYEYGNTAESRMAANPYFAHIKEWALNKISDADGNSVQFVYTKDAGWQLVRRYELAYGNGDGLEDIVSPNGQLLCVSRQHQRLRRSDRYRRMRKQTIYTNGNIETWWHIGGLFEKRTRTSSEYRHIIVGGDGPVAIRLRDGSGSTTYYLANDHLGSTNTITSSAGALLANASYDALGKRRGSNWTGAPSSAELTQITNATKHGFTFHEHLANLTLTHMQGRVFDPVIGRFMSADPFVQASFNSQSLNRYSYVFNNPLSFIDPSGFAGVDGPDSPGSSPIPGPTTCCFGGRGNGRPETDIVELPTVSEIIRSWSPPKISSSPAAPRYGQASNQPDQARSQSTSGGNHNLFPTLALLGPLFFGTDADRVLRLHLQQRDGSPPWSGNHTWNGTFGRLRPDLIHIGGVLRQIFSK